MDYPLLWFVLWGVLWTAYFVTGGFDLGAGMLLFHLGKTAGKKQALLESFGPLWNGNEVWLITAGGATFAAFPTAYAVMFSSFYIPFLLILFALIVRGVALEFREKLSASTWQTACNAAIVAGSVITAFLFGIIFGNLFQGLPMDNRGFSGSFPQLLNPYALLTGFLFSLLFLMHGALWIAFRTEGDLALRAAAFARHSWIPLATAVILFFLFSGLKTHLFVNYLHNAFLFAFPALSLLALTAVMFYLKKSAFLKAFVASGLNVILLMTTAFFGLFPNLLPSLTDPVFNITVFNAASNPYTLKIMTVVAAIFVPLIIFYQSWIYRIFKEKIPAEGSGENLYL